VRFASRRLRWIIVLATLLALVAAVWLGAVEYWVGKELRALAAAHLVPSFDFDDLNYTFPSTITLERARLTSPDPEESARSIEILSIDVLTLSLDGIPHPNQPFRIRQLDSSGPTLRLVPIRDREELVGVVGFSELLKEAPERAPQITRKPSDLFEVRTASIRRGSVEFDPRDDGGAIMQVDGIAAQLVLTPDKAGAYRIDFSLDQHPALDLRLRGRVLADERRIEGANLALTLEVAREQDHYLTPALQTFLAERDISGHLKLTASGELDLDEAVSARLAVKLELSDASYAQGGYGVKLDRVSAAVSSSRESVSLTEVTVEALGGEASLTGTIGLDAAAAVALRFEASKLQIAELLRGANDPGGKPLFSGLLDFSGVLRGPLAQLQVDSSGSGHLTLREARLGRLPVLSTIDEALDRTAEAFMKRQQKGHANLSVGFGFDGDHVELERLRMNDRWYGLRGHGKVFFDTRLDLAVEGGPVQRLENEIGAAGDVLGEITETLLRARVSGTMGDPRVEIEVLRGFP
jgi:hypothetical protein